VKRFKSGTNYVRAHCLKKDLSRDWSARQRQSRALGPDQAISAWCGPLGASLRWIRRTCREQIPRIFPGNGSHVL